MFEGFEDAVIDTDEAVIRVRRGGDGPPVLLLHGIPQTHVMWHKIAPRLAAEFTRRRRPAWLWGQQHAGNDGRPRTVLEASGLLRRIAQLAEVGASARTHVPV